MNRHFLQSPVWEKFERSEGHEVFVRDGEGYSALVVVKNTPVGKYLFCPYGPALESPERFRTALDSLATLAREQEAMFVRVEPTCLGLDKSAFSVRDKDVIAVDKCEEVADCGVAVDILKKNGLKKTHDIDPAHTWVVNLSQSEEEILRGTERDRVRHWRNHEARGVKIEKTKNPEEITKLTDLLQKLGEAREFTPQDTEHLKKQLQAGFATLYTAEFEGVVIAATLVHDYEKTRFVMHVAADDDYRKQRGGTSLALEAMMDFKREGGEWFDFWGITTSEDSRHPWYGFTQYKKSFKGFRVDYSGTWDYVVNPAKYRVYSLLRKVNRVKRKISR